MRPIITTIVLAAFGTWSLAAMAQTGTATGGGTAGTSTTNQQGTGCSRHADRPSGQWHRGRSKPTQWNRAQFRLSRTASRRCPHRRIRRQRRPVEGWLDRMRTNRMSTVPGTGMTGAAGGRAGFPGNTGPMGQSQSTLPGGASMARPNSPSGVGPNSPTMNNNINNLNVPPGTGNAPTRAQSQPRRRCLDHRRRPRQRPQRQHWRQHCVQRQCWRQW